MMPTKTDVAVVNNAAEKFIENTKLLLGTQTIHGTVPIGPLR